MNIQANEVDSIDVEEVYNIIIDALSQKKVSRSAAICGLLSVAAVQTRGEMLTQDELLNVVNACSEWLSLYLVTARGPVQ